MPVSVGFIKTWQESLGVLVDTPDRQQSACINARLRNGLRCGQAVLQGEAEDPSKFALMAIFANPQIWP